MAEINLHVNFRPEQLRLYSQRRRFSVRVCHRRFGKTWLVLSELFIDAMSTSLGDWRGFYIGPTYKQAKRISWDILKGFVRSIPGCAVHEQELRVDFPNGSRIQLIGADNPDALRGAYADAIAMDETQLLPYQQLYAQTVRPLLIDRKGWLVVMGTPQFGRYSALYTLFQYAKTQNDPEWIAHFLPVTHTNIIPKAELEALRRQMSKIAFDQEMLCDFTAAQLGAYLAREMQQVQDEERITTIRYQTALPVIVSLDLGHSDATVAIFWQQHGTEHRAIACRAYKHTKLSDIVNDWRSLPFPIHTVLAPHDAGVTELGSGLTRTEVLEQYGCDVIVVPRIKDKHQGIDQLRELLGNCWFDATECATLIDALFGYRSEVDEVRGVQRLTPLHSWESDYADSAMCYAQGRHLASPANWGAISGDEMAARANRRYWA